MMRRPTWLALAIALAAGAVAPAHAQDALYGKQPPHGSAFVRLVNALPAAVTITTDFQAEAHLGTSPTDRVAPYTVVERAAERTLTITAKQGARTGRLNYKAPADGYVTLAVEADPGGNITIMPIVDQAEFNQTRARLAFYNLAPGCASATLGLDPSGPAVFQGLPNGSTKSRTVNPVQATVRATCSASAGPTLALAGMELGASYSIWLMQPGADMTLFLTPDVSARYKPQG
jgi:hypothetical protein